MKHHCQSTDKPNSQKMAESDAKDTGKKNRCGMHSPAEAIALPLSSSHMQLGLMLKYCAARCSVKIHIWQ